MARYVAFLRAINVSGRFVKMEHVREIFDSMDFGNVEIYIQSGNVIIKSDETETTILEQLIRARLEKDLGFEVPTFVRTKAELLAVESYSPFPASELEDVSKLYVSFLQTEPTAERQKALIDLSNEIDQFHIHKTQVYWLSCRHLGKTRYTNAHIEKTLKMPATRRNMNTIRKIVK